MQIAVGTTGSAGFMNLGSWISRYLARRRRIRTLTRVVREYSGRLFPGSVPVWSMIAEERHDECVVYLTYQRTGPGSPTLHRFFLVRLPDLSVIPLQEDYTPARWGPFQ